MTVNAYFFGGGDHDLTKKVLEKYSPTVTFAIAGTSTHQIESGDMIVAQQEIYECIWRDNTTAVYRFRERRLAP